MRGRTGPCAAGAFPSAAPEGAQVAPGTPVNLTESTGMKADGKPCITE